MGGGGGGWGVSAFEGERGEEGEGLCVCFPAPSPSLTASLAPRGEMKPRALLTCIARAQGCRGGGEKAPGVGACRHRVPLCQRPAGTPVLPVSLEWVREARFY